MISTDPHRPQAVSSPPFFLSGRTVSWQPVCALLCLLLALTGCSNGEAEKGQKGKSGKNATAVTTALCRSMDVPVIIEATGRVEASATVGIRSRINGTLDSIHFKEGQEVQKGDILFTIDSRPYLAQVKAKEALLAKDQAELAQARKAHERYQPAAQNGYVSQDQADQAAAKVASLTAAARADEAALDAARLDLQFCSLTAPITGIAGEIQADAGNLIKANADTPLVTINRITPITIAFPIPGDGLPGLQRYQAQAALSVQAKVPGGAKATVDGTLGFIDNTIDPATGTLLAKADFANSGKELWPGQLVPVSLRLTTRKGALVVPNQAVQTGQDGAHVYVVRDDATVEYRQVTAGAKTGGDRVIEKGLKAGEKVVTDGHLQLVEGGKIIERQDQPAGQQKKGGKRGNS